jgi:mitochondrial import receptor subunit TOM20
MSRTSSILALVGVTVVGGLLAYAAYFDYKRRTDVEFRKRLRTFSTPSSPEF